MEIFKKKAGRIFEWISKYYKITHIVNIVSSWFNISPFSKPEQNRQHLYPNILNNNREVITFKVSQIKHIIVH